MANKHKKTDEQIMQEALSKSLKDPSVSVDGAGVATIKLNRPISVGDREIEVVTLKAEATLDDIEQSDKGKTDLAKARNMIAALSDLSMAHAGKLRTDDMNKIMPLVGELAGKGHLTGGFL